MYIKGIILWQFVILLQSKVQQLTIPVATIMGVGSGDDGYGQNHSVPASSSYGN